MLSVKRSANNQCKYEEEQVKVSSLRHVTNSYNCVRTRWAASRKYSWVCVCASVPVCVCVCAWVRGCVSCSVYLCLCVSLLHCSTTLMQIAEGFVQVAVVACKYTLYSLRVSTKGVLALCWRGWNKSFYCILMGTIVCLFQSYQRNSITALRFDFQSS